MHMSIKKHQNLIMQQHKYKGYMMKKELYNRKLECYNKDGTKLSRKFHKLVKEFVFDACKVYNTIEVETILKDSIDQQCCIHRAKQGINKMIGD